jgi:hypothetical protein
LGSELVYRSTSPKIKYRLATLEITSRRNMLGGSFEVMRRCETEGTRIEHREGPGERGR